MSAIQRAWLGFTVLVAMAVVAGFFMRDGNALGLLKPSDANADLQSNFLIYQAIFSGWIAMLLLFPTFLAIWGTSYESRAVWLAFWTVSCGAYLSHVFITTYLYFVANWDWTAHSGPIQTAWPLLILAVWWAFDVVRAWVYGFWVTVQRIVLHIAVVLVVVVAAVEPGELFTIKLLSWALLATSLVSFYIAMKRRRAR